MFISIFWTVSMARSPQAFPLSVEHYLSIKAADLLIDKMESDVRKEQSWNHWRKRTILKGKSAQIISLSLPRQQSRIVHLQIIALLIPLQVLSIWVNANAVFVSFRRKMATRKYTTFSPVNGALSSASASVFLSLGVICFVSSVQSQSRS